MPWGIVAGAAIGAVGSIVSGDQAAGAARDAANSTVGENARQFNLVRGDTQYQRQLGANATAQLSRLFGYGPSQVDPATGSVVGSPSGTPDMSGFFKSPDYTFTLGEGEKAINNSLVARGRGLSGSALKAGTSYASGLASKTYNDYVNQLLQQAGLGSAGVSTSAQAGAQAASNDSQAYAIEGNARASAYGNAAAGVNNSIQGGVGNYLLSRYLGKGGGGGSPTTGDYGYGPGY